MPNLSPRERRIKAQERKREIERERENCKKKRANKRMQK